MRNVRLRGRPHGRASNRRLSYANVASTLALVVALGGGTAWATHTYIITSTTQIKPSVLTKLHGKRGRTGKNGINGATGATGATGANLTSQTLLASGQSESGAFAGAGGPSEGSSLADAITYVQPLAAPIATANVIWNLSGTTSAHCPGVGRADPGYLCLYDNEQQAVSDPACCTPAFPPFYSPGGPGSPSWGAILYWTVTGGDGYVNGEYTVTAP